MIRNIKIALVFTIVVVILVVMAHILANFYSPMTFTEAALSAWYHIRFSLVCWFTASLIAWPLLSKFFNTLNYKTAVGVLFCYTIIQFIVAIPITMLALRIENLGNTFSIYHLVVNGAYSGMYYGCIWTLIYFINIAKSKA